MQPGRTLAAVASAATLILSISSIANAQAFAATERFGYTGTVTKYGSLTDAQNGTNAVGTTSSFPQRDLSLYFIDNNPAFSGAGYPPSDAQFLTNWYAPSNGNQDQNYGFIQLNDANGSSVTSTSASWNDAARTSFSFSATGAATVPGCTDISPTTLQDCGRLWNGSTATPSAAGGSFVSWFVSFTATGLDAATFNATDGVWESDSDPTGVVGSMSGIFMNTSTDDAGYYVYNLDMNMTNQAYGNGETSPSAFGTNTTTTPEPTSFALLGSGLVGLVPMVRRRKRR